jgi:hypothetical protein
MWAESVNGKIVNEIYRALEKLGADPMLLGIIGSWGDTLSDQEVLTALWKWNEGTIPQKAS